MKLIFDIETNGLRPCDKIHCLAIINQETKEKWLFEGHKEIQAKGLPLLSDAEMLIGHNIIGFDLLVLNDVFGWKPKSSTFIYDTLVAIKLDSGDQSDTDFRRRPVDLQKKNYGSHSLEAWGERLGHFKTDFKANTKGMSKVEAEEAVKLFWNTYTPEMGKYCLDDVSVNDTIYQYLLSRNIEQKALDMEIKFAILMQEQENDGYPFDINSAQNLVTTLTAEREKIFQELTALFPPRIEKRMSEKTGKPLKDKVIEFNPGSRDHIAREFSEKYGWKPTSFTPSGKPEIDSEVLEALDYPEAKELNRYFVINKLLGYISEGNGAWMKLVDNNGVIHGRVNSIGAATGRCTHNAPNMAQIPSVRKPFGAECRALFHAPKGYKQVGADLQAIETRLFAHYLAIYDDGEYGKFVESEDIHTYNQHAAGLPTRQDAKGFIYALLYGAGDAKLGSIIGGGKPEGAAIRKKFYTQIPAVEKLTKAVKTASENKGWVKGLDGRRLHCRKAHAALNTLLQGAGAICQKTWTVVVADMLAKKGLKKGYMKDWWFAANVHDEIQLIVKEGYETMVSELLVSAAHAAGESLGMRCKMEAESKIGQNWSDCH